MVIVNAYVLTLMPLSTESKLVRVEENERATANPNPKEENALEMTKEENALAMMKNDADDYTVESAKEVGGAVKRPASYADIVRGKSSE